ncbi:MAG: gliding motility-associated C-terminal domain-containing protein [Bacteroidota bacterium]
MKYFSIILLLLLISGVPLQKVTAQIQLSPASKINTKCDGIGCNYYGPSILINEVMISPLSGDGSMAGHAYNSTNPQAGEWIELYNPHLCKAVDISCYFLGNNTEDTDSLGGHYFGGGYEIPEGTVVPPRGFCVVRGVNADPVPSNLLVQNGGKTIEIIINSNSSYCLGGGYRLWFPNAGGWFAFYNTQGVPQDAISWSVVPAYNNPPCNPPGNCPYNGVLPAYDQIPSDHKKYIFSFDLSLGFSEARMPDGGPWAVDQNFTPTYATSNATPVPPPVITCNGKASVSVSGGVPPYSFIWNDGQSQTNDTAVGLCEGTYCVTVTDAAGVTAQTCVEVFDYKLNVNLAPFDSICESAPPFPLTHGSPAGGVYSGDGVSGLTYYPDSAGQGTHKIFYTWYNVDSCYGIDSSLITVVQGVDFSMPSPQNVCIDTPPFLLSGATPAGGTYSGSGVQNNYFSAVESGPGTFTISYDYQSNSFCQGQATMQITVNPLPVMGLSPFQQLCEKSPQIMLSGGTPSGGTYLGNAVSGGFFDPVLSGDGDFPITYSYTDLKGCTDDTSAILTVNPNPSVHVNANPPLICKGDKSTLFVSGALNYNWNPAMANASQIVVSPIQTTNFYVTGIDVHGCEDSDSCRVSVIPLPVINLPAAVWMMTGDPVQLESFSGPFQYLWSTGETSQWITVQKPGLYWLSVKDTFCVAKDTVEVVEIPAIYVPNAFTPDFDGLNDFFGPISAFPVSIKFRVFTRWGEQIFESNDLNILWDGTYRNSPAPCDVYSWILEWDFVYTTHNNTNMGLKGQKQGMVLLLK